MPSFPRRHTTVRALAEQLQVWSRFEAGVSSRLGTAEGAALLEQLASLPVRPSRSVRMLGAYIYRGDTPVAIRIQFAQEEVVMAETLLHELAHACNHLHPPAGRTARQTHGASWQGWARAFGIAPSRKGCSEAIDQLYASRLKVVAVCKKCGAEFRRLRKMAAGRSYIHPGCGGGEIVPCGDEG